MTVDVAVVRCAKVLRLDTSWEQIRRFQDRAQIGKCEGWVGPGRQLQIVIAECVEDPAMLMSLYECGVDFVQGYVIGMPRMHLYLAMAALNQAPPDFQQQIAG